MEDKWTEVLMVIDVIRLGDSRRRRRQWPQLLDGEQSAHLPPHATHLRIDIRCCTAEYSDSDSQSYWPSTASMTAVAGQWAIFLLTCMRYSSLNRLYGYTLRPSLPTTNPFLSSVTSKSSHRRYFFIWIDGNTLTYFIHPQRQLPTSQKKGDFAVVPG